MIRKITLAMLLLTLIMVPAVYAQDDDEEAEIPEGFEQVVSENEYYRLLIPEGWLLETERTQISVASTEETLAKLSSSEEVSLEAGETAMQILLLDPESLEFLGVDPEADFGDTADTIIQALLTGDADDFELGDVEVITDEEDEDTVLYAFASLLTPTWEGGLFVNTFLTADEVEIYGVVISAAAIGEYEDVQADIVTVFESLEIALESIDFSE